jgi:hypothetical protein
MSILPAKKPCRLKALIRNALAKSTPKARKPKGVPAQPSSLELELRGQIMAAGLTRGIQVEFLAIPGRKLRWDIAWPERRLLVEIQGGIWRKGGHSTGTGITRDCEKANLATLAGWRILSVTSAHISSGQALQWIQQALGCKNDFQ